MARRGQKEEGGRSSIEGWANTREQGRDSGRAYIEGWTEVTGRRDEKKLDESSMSW